jgi:hypothetical protein
VVVMLTRVVDDDMTALVAGTVTLLPSARKPNLGAAPGARQVALAAPTAPGGLVSAPAAPGQAFSNLGPRGPGRPGAGPGYPSGFSEIADVRA